MMLGLLLLIVDVKMGYFFYPAFEEFHSEAPETVNMVINHVVTDEWQMDLFSDIAGFILIMYASKWFRERFPEHTKSNARMKNVFKWCIIGIITRLMNAWMPFFLNGNLRYRLAYGFYFLALIAEVTTMIKTMMALDSYLETPENHDYNNRSAILALITTGAGTVSMIMWFYDLYFGYAIYFVVELLVFMWYALRIMVDSLVQKDLETTYEA